MEPHCAAACSFKKAFHISTSVSVCVCVRECRHERHRLNLHGNDVPVSQAPARTRGRVGSRGSVTQAKRGKTSGVGALKRIRLPKNIQLNLPFSIAEGAVHCEIIATMATKADSEKISFVKKTVFLKINTQLHFRKYNSYTIQEIAGVHEGSKKTCSFIRGYHFLMFLQFNFDTTGEFHLRWCKRF